MLSGDREIIDVHIGVDDVDSLRGGCTTHFATRVTKLLVERKIVFRDYLNLIRLNPAIPWKTRGNGAVALRIGLRSSSEIEDVWGLIRSELEEYTRLLEDPKHQPCIVLHVGEIPGEYKWVSNKALYDVVPLDVVSRLIGKNPNTRIYCINGKRGIIGSIAAIGYDMVNRDYTYELIAYRSEDYWGSPRLIDINSIKHMDRLYGEHMILNYDYETDRPLITPRGPDPVLLGLRGEDPRVLVNAYRVLEIYEPVEYIAMYRTNQHTDSHIHPVSSVCEIRPYTCISASGVVYSNPVRLMGGHVVFKLCDRSCCIDVVAYEPTKWFRERVEKLIEGDEVEVYGCIRPSSLRHGLTVNLEKIRVIKLAEQIIYENPRCPRCNLRMESMGRGKGYRCRKCGFKDPSAVKIGKKIERSISTGWYQPPRSVFKHLMKPIERFGKEKEVFEEMVFETPLIELT